MEFAGLLPRVWVTAVAVLMVIPTGGQAEEGNDNPRRTEDWVIWHYQNHKGQHLSQNLTTNMFRSKELYLANLPMDIKHHELEDRFSKHGKVADIRIARVQHEYLKILIQKISPIRDTYPDLKSGRPLGFGFVTFATPHDAMGAYVALKSKWICGRALTIQIAKSRQDLALKFTSMP
eukprot:jgi/Bigna1/137561/aug1.40_g12269